jgi:hypothetical protein
MDARLQQEINVLGGKLRRMSADVKNEAKKDIKEAGGLLVAALKGRVPVGSKPHSRYKRIKKKGKRMPKGFGVKLATYRPGNLRRAYRVLNLRRTKLGVIIGPLLGGKSTDGYYVHMVNNNVKQINGTIRAGKGFVQAAIAVAGDAALQNIIGLLSRRINAEAQKQGIK